MAKPIALVIEDDPMLVDIYQMMLQQIGFDTLHDKNGNEFMGMVSTIQPSLIVLDLHMPYASSPDMLRQIRDDPRLSKVPIIVTTADIIRAKSLEGQVGAVLIKPVSFARLRDTALRLCPLEPDNYLKNPLNP